MKKYILPIITLIISLITIISIIKLNMIPNKYLLIIILIEILLLLIGTILNINKSKILKIIGIILLIINIIINLIGLYYINNTNKFIKNNFTKEIKYTSVYYLITNKDNNNKIEDLDESENILYYEYSKNIDKAKEILGNYKYEKTNNIIDTLNNLKGYLLIDKTNYDITDINKENLKIIYEFNVEITEKRINKKQDSYNIYIGGRDFTRELTDFNMLITINNKTKTILLTSIPRDYYLDIPNFRKDSIEFMGLLGENVIMSSLENLFDTEINYYGSLYTDGLVEIVDKLGGIEFCSDQTFTTTHALVQNTYKDVGEKLTIQKGCHHLNGIETLTVARERKHVGSDRKRQENCRQIFKNIMNKSLSTTTLTNYEELLSSVSNLYQTNMDDKTITTLIKNLINDKYKVLEQNVDGSDGENYIRQGTVKSYVMYPYENTVNNAKQKIKEVLEGWNI